MQSRNILGLCGGILALALAISACRDDASLGHNREPKTSDQQVQQGQAAGMAGMSSTTGGSGAGSGGSADGGADLDAQVDATNTDPLAGLNKECVSDACPPNLTPVHFYGVAGMSGPRFCWCSIPCADNPAKCPAGTTCTTIADGPGNVCYR